jgi:hypothetical protein
MLRDENKVLSTEIKKIKERKNKLKQEILKTKLSLVK